MQTFNAALGNDAFRTEGSRQLNAAVFDSMSVGLARRINHGIVHAPGPSDVAKVHNALLRDDAYRETVAGGTAGGASANARMNKAIEAFGTI